MKRPTLGKLLDAMMQAMPALKWQVYSLPLATDIQFGVTALLPRPDSYVIVSCGAGDKFAATVIHLDGPSMWLTPYFDTPADAFNHALHRSMNYPPDMVADPDETPDEQPRLRAVKGGKKETP